MLSPILRRLTAAERQALERMAVADRRPLVDQAALLISVGLRQWQERQGALQDDGQEPREAVA
jgi:hypothetical protein